MTWIKGGLALFVVGFFVYLYTQARRGDAASIAILAVWAALFLVLVGGGIALAFMAMQYKMEQSRFKQNVNENLAMMGAVQRVQNQQNAMLLRQAREGQRALLAPGSETIDALEYDDAVFSELDAAE